MLLLWMRPERPTPMSTKAPNKAVLSTRPVSTEPTRRSLIDTMPCLKSACPKSKREGRDRKYHKDEVVRCKWEGCRCQWHTCGRKDRKRECRKAKEREEMTNRCYISSGNLILVPAYFHFSQHSILHHFPLGPFERDPFSFPSHLHKQGRLAPQEIARFNYPPHSTDFMR